MLLVPCPPCHVLDRLSGTETKARKESGVTFTAVKGGNSPVSTIGERIGKYSPNMQKNIA